MAYEGCLVYVPPRAHQRQEKFHRAIRGEIIAPAEAGIHENGTLICFDEKTSYSVLYMWEIGSHRATVEEVNGHGGEYSIKT
jgi:hypothetical protein